jgi:hypothetical protein
MAYSIEKSLKALMNDVRGLRLGEIVRSDEAEQGVDHEEGLSGNHYRFVRRAGLRGPVFNGRGAGRRFSAHVEARF